MTTWRKSLSILATICCFVLILGGCSKSNPGINKEAKVEDKKVGYQLDKPSKGDRIAVMHVKIGEEKAKDIYIRLFPEAAPKAVENFIKHSQDGYYKDVTFHRVEKDLVIQGGDPEGTGQGGKSIYTDNEKGTFEDEFTDKVFNLKGSLAMANSGVNTNGSQFYFNTMTVEKNRSAKTMQEQYEIAKKQYSKYKKDYKSQSKSFADIASSYQVQPIEVPFEVLELYEKHGGNIGWDGAWQYEGGHTVFGQVYEGMEVLDEINKVEVNQNNKPEKDVVITGIDIKTY